MGKIKFLVMDVDGTLTDGKIYMSDIGEAMKAFDVKDGCGIKDILPKYGILPIIITGRESKIVANRCEELEIKHVYQGIRDKKKQLQNMIDTYNAENQTNYSWNNVAYIGDDILDIDCMKAVNESGGIVGAPADAVAEVIKTADYISDKNGGNGAVRDFIDWMVNLK